MSLTMKQRSALIQAAERGLSIEPAANRGDRLLCITCVAIAVFFLLGVL